MIIIIIILAGITINTLIGDNGIIFKTGLAKESAEIADEKDIIEQSKIEAMEKDKFKELTYAKFTKYMNINSNDGVEIEKVDGDFYVTFKESKRIYKVDREGNIVYLGTYSELADTATIIANPEDDTYPKITQKIDITVETIVRRLEDEVVIHYGWSKDKNIEATNYKKLEVDIDTTQRKRTGKAIIDDAEGNYYLWIKVEIDNNVVKQKYGPYAIKSHTALVSTASENAATAGFLGSNKFENSKEVTRDRINSVKIADTFTDENGVTHTINDSNCWDVSVAQDKKSILAWFEVAKDKDGNEVKNADNKTMYNITIAQEGGVTARADSKHLFYNVGRGGTGENVITGLEYLDTHETTNFQGMFAECAAKSLDLSRFDTEKAMNMTYMFYNCPNLISIDVSGFDTSNVTNMRNMFQNCKSLTSLDVSNFKTDSLTSLYYTFCGCTNLKSLNVSNLNTSNVVDFGYTFYSCKSLEELDVTGFDTKNATSMISMFCHCNKIKSLDLKSFNVKKVYDFRSMFDNCSNLTNLDLNNFYTDGATLMSQMFRNCTNLKSLNIANFNTSKITDFYYMFGGCSALEGLDITSFETENAISMQGMFTGCSKLTSLDLKKFNVKKVSNFNYMFDGCSSLTSLDLSNFYTDSATGMLQMFYNCTNLKSLNVSNFNTSNVADFYLMFCDCSTLEELDLTSFDTKNVKSMRFTFNSTSSIKQILVSSSWVVGENVNTEGMFALSNVRSVTYVE